MAVVIFMMVGQVVKTNIFTKSQAAKRRKSQWFWWWAFKTLPLHPIAAGLVTGLLWPNPEADVSGIGAVFYFMGAGAGSVFAFQVLKGLLKKKGVDLDVPGESMPAPALEKPAAADETIKP
jgi:hypothetical protein